MFWEKGAAHEQAVMRDVGVPVLDLSAFYGDENERLTTEAMQRQEPTIYSGRIIADDLGGRTSAIVEKVASVSEEQTKREAGRQA
jgi:hypothetical protein